MTVTISVSKHFIHAVYGIFLYVLATYASLPFLPGHAFFPDYSNCNFNSTPV